MWPKFGIPLSLLPLSRSSSRSLPSIPGSFPPPPANGRRLRAQLRRRRRVGDLQRQRLRLQAPPPPHPAGRGGGRPVHRRGPGGRAEAALPGPPPALPPRPSGQVPAGAGAVGSPVVGSPRPRSPATARRRFVFATRATVGGAAGASGWIYPAALGRWPTPSGTGSVWRGQLFKS